MKRDAFLNNVGRGAVADEDALFAALRDGMIGGAALDTWWRYPTPEEPISGRHATRSTTCPM